MIAKTTKPVPPNRKPYFDPALNCYRLPLASGQTALIDAQDVEYASCFRWTFVPKTGPGRQEKWHNSAIISLARIITNAGPSDRIIHRDDDYLNCRRDNLMVGDWNQKAYRHRKTRTRSGRPVTSKFKGVHWDDHGGQRPGAWRASIRVHYKLHSLGRFQDEIRAAEAYDAAAFKYFGQFARLNFPEQYPAITEDK